jgi:hypothetical protein
MYDEGQYQLAMQNIKFIAHIKPTPIKPTGVIQGKIKLILFL